MLWFPCRASSNHPSEVLAGNAMIDAVDNNADLMVTPCPLCHLKMDTYQDDIGKVIGRDVELPVLHMPPDGSFSFWVVLPKRRLDLNYPRFNPFRSHYLRREVKLGTHLGFYFTSKTIYTPSRVCVTTSKIVPIKTY